MDEIFKPYCDLILQHLSGNEMKKLTEVSSKFNKIIEESKCFKQKIIFIVHYPNVPEFDSTRNYLNVMFKCNSKALIPGTQAELLMHRNLDRFYKSIKTLKVRNRYTNYL